VEDATLPWIDANGVSIRYQLAGTGGPVVVLMHEIGGSLESFDQIVPVLSGRFRVLRYDQRGAGLSEKVRKEFSLQMQVEDLEALLAALDLAPPYHFVTIAAAAAQALLFMDRGEGRIASLVLCNPAFGVDASRAGQLEERAAFAEREGMRAALAMTLDRSYPPELTDRATYDTYRGYYLANDPVCFAFANRVLARHNAAHLIQRISCPTMIVAGRHDAVRPPAGSEEVARKIPGARYELIDSGHFMPVQAPGPLRDLLLDFLPR
jgi:3-oxoadipate enol-lactonase